MKRKSSKLFYSPTDLIRYAASPFASWMERLHVENPDAVIPDAESADKRLIAETGDKHEQTVLAGLKGTTPGLIEIPKHDEAIARGKTIEALQSGAPIVYQAFLELDEFTGYADFLIRNNTGAYQVWDTKLARAPKPYYAIQLCCYSEMLAHLLDIPFPEKFGIILGTEERVELRVEDYIHYYRSLKAAFLKMHLSFNGRIEERPEAPVCVLSLCSSYGEYGSRGLAFILDRNRINVAISRAKCMAIIVADPRIATAEAGSLDEMALLNHRWLRMRSMMASLARVFGQIDSACQAPEGGDQPFDEWAASGMEPPGYPWCSIEQMRLTNNDLQDLRSIARRWSGARNANGAPISAEDKAPRPRPELRPRPQV